MKKEMTNKEAANQLEKIREMFLKWFPHKKQECAELEAAVDMAKDALEQPAQIDGLPLLSLYTGYALCDFNSIHKLAEEYMGRPILSHMFADKNLWHELQDLCREDYFELVRRLNKK